MDNSFSVDKTIIFKPHFSLWLLVVSAMTHALVTMSIWICDLPFFIQIVLFFIVLLSCRYSLGASSISMLWAEPSGVWQLQWRSGETQKAELLSSTVITRWMIVLHFKCIETHYPVRVVLPVDALPFDSRRLLRARVLSLENPD